LSFKEIKVTTLRGNTKEQKNENNLKMFLFKQYRWPVQTRQVLFENLNGKENISIIANF
jgi:hypothetical protein